MDRRQSHNQKANHSAFAQTGSDFTRREFLAGSVLSALLPEASSAPGPDAAPPPGPEPSYSHRTQFDRQLLCQHPGAARPVLSNHGRQLGVTAEGHIITALAWNGDRHLLRIWREMEMIAEHSLAGDLSAPILIPGAGGTMGLWISAGEEIRFAPDAAAQPEPIAGLRGFLLDGLATPDGRVLLLLGQANDLFLGVFDGREARQFEVERAAGRGCIAIDEEGVLHLVFERREGIEYRRFAGNTLPTSVAQGERIAEAFGSYPVITALSDRILVAYLGESCRPSIGVEGSPARDRLGRGGYIAALVCENGRWERFRLADSCQVAKPLRPVDGAFGGSSDTEIELLVRVEEFSPPALCLGPDGVPEVYWADTTRRWVYGARYLGSGFSHRAEVRGPIEELTGPCLTPRRVLPGRRDMAVAIPTSSRCYLDRVALAPSLAQTGRRIDFVQPDMIAAWKGLELRVNQLRRHPANPVIPTGKPGELDDGAVVADISRAGSGWRADIAYFSAPNADPAVKGGSWRWGGRAASSDGIHWTKLPPEPLTQQYVLEGVKEHTLPVRFVEDTAEPDPGRRFKGLWRSKEHEPWGFLAVVSSDSVHWSFVKDNAAVVRADDDLRLWIDDADAPERRFKATGIGRSFCGRVCSQWTSPDGTHWNDERDTLDYRRPFSARPDLGSTGRILLDSWSGPDDEDEIHGGYVFRDGDRWLLHYMKWTADGHIYCALASSRDGLNFARVAGGLPTLPLGAPGTWDGGRVAVREAPHRVGNVWRQYYTGCGWKHGLGGLNVRPSFFGLNAPNQMGLAEIGVGRWVHLQVERDAQLGTLTTIPLRLERPHRLALDVEGLTSEGGGVACAVLDPQSQRTFKGFGFDDCDRLTRGESGTPVTWRGRGLESLGSAEIRLRFRIRGYGVRFYGADLIPLEGRR